MASLFWDDGQTPNAFSGMPWNMSRALQNANCEVIPILIGKTPFPRGSRLFEDSGSNRMLKGLSYLGSQVRNRRDDLFHRRVFVRLMEQARLTAGRGARGLAEIECDVIFGSGMSIPFAYLSSQVPIIYATDATARLLIDSYPKVAALGKGRRAAILDQETRAIANSDVVVVPSGYCRRSMIADHGAREEQVSIVPLGANIEPESSIFLPAPAPKDRRLDLLLCAADPERKQLRLAAAVVRELRNRGWHARLHYIGPKHACCAFPEVAWAGELCLGDPDDSRRHRSLLKSCHFSFLPSLSEMYGIAPIESAAYGRPAIVSDVGGLSTVVEDGVTGRVLPLQTPISGWADAIEAILAFPQRYEIMSKAAHRRYAEVLNWDVWGQTVRGLAETAIRSRSAREDSGRPG